MKSDDPNLDILQNLEFGVIEVFRKHPEMTDYVVLRAYEATFQHYRAEFRGGTPKASTLTGLDGEVFEVVRQMCEFRLGRGGDASALKGEMLPAPVETIVDCLRKLMRSVEFNTKQGGRQGYLNFVSRFV